MKCWACDGKTWTLWAAAFTSAIASCILRISASTRVHRRPRPLSDGLQSRQRQLNSFGNGRITRPRKQRTSAITTGTTMTFSSPKTTDRQCTRTVSRHTSTASRRSTASPISTHTSSGTRWLRCLFSITSTPSRFRSGWVIHRSVQRPIFTPISWKKLTSEVLIFCRSFF